MRDDEDLWTLCCRTLVVGRRYGLTVDEILRAVRTWRRMEQGVYDRWPRSATTDLLDRVLGSRRYAADRRTRTEGDRSS